jgi:hypothetical protein
MGITLELLGQGAQSLARRCRVDITTPLVGPRGCRLRRPWSALTAWPGNQVPHHEVGTGTDTSLVRRARMVLRERIELSTSPLPRECSTTELPQQAGECGGLLP